MEQSIPQLKPTQIQLLKQLYKFRFVTNNDLAYYRTTGDTITVFRSLEALVKLGYVLKRYEPSYRIDRRSAVYSLAKQGIHFLRSLGGFNEQAFHAMYRNNVVADEFIAEHLATLQIAGAIRKHYPDEFDIFTRIELIEQDYFPDPRPHLYLRRRKASSEPSEFILFMVSDSQQFIFRKKQEKWITHFEEEGWDGAYPTVLLVCDTPSIERRIREYIANRIPDDDLTVMVSTKKALTANEESRVWSHYLIDDALYAL